jgi:hypothetical protein
LAVDVREIKEPRGSAQHWINENDGSADPQVMSHKQPADAVVISLDRRRAKKRRTLSDMEEAVGRAASEAAERAVKDLIAEHGSEDGTPKPCPQCSNATGVHTKDVSRTLTSLHGSHTLVRNYHFCRRCAVGFYPRDAELGLPVDGALSLEMERRVLDFAVNGPYEECAARWSMHYPAHPMSANQFRQVAERVGKRAEEAERRRL